MLLNPQNKSIKNKLPTVRELWNIKFQKQEFGSNTTDEVYLSMGRALSKWEEIEGTFGKFFRIFIESKSIAGERAYCSMTSVSSRREVLLQTARVYYDRRHHSDGKKILNIKDFELMLDHYQFGANFRNQIAHGLATPFLANENGIDKNYGSFLVSSMFSKKSVVKNWDFWKQFGSGKMDKFGIFGHGYKYTHNDIDRIFKIFETFSLLLNEMLVELEEYVKKIT